MDCNCWMLTQPIAHITKQYTPRLLVPTPFMAWPIATRYVCFSLYLGHKSLAHPIKHCSGRHATALNIWYMSKTTVDESPGPDQAGHLQQPSGVSANECQTTLLPLLSRDQIYLVGVWGTLCIDCITGVVGDREIVLS